MRGSADGGAREATLALTVPGLSERRVEVEATIDTGFTGALCLPQGLVESLSPPLVGRGVAVLADGRAVEANYHRSRIIWHGREPVAQVLATEGGRLVDMSLPRGSVLTVAVSPGGHVAVEEIR